MKKQLSVILLLAAAVLLYLAPAYSQEDMTQLFDPAFTTHQRPAAVFNHDGHNEKAEIEDCSVCHHVYEGERKVMDDSSEGTPCSECHAVDAEEGTPLRMAYHRMCIDCHTAKGKGPVTCGECHVDK
ncbi:MAG: acidic tetraheme cytochrome c3 TmcA [Desulfovibrionaceae bacterium]